MLCLSSLGNKMAASSLSSLCYPIEEVQMFYTVFSFCSETLQVFSIFHTFFSKVSDTVFIIIFYSFRENKY